MLHQVKDIRVPRMNVGDCVRFRRGSKAWKIHGLEPDTKGYVTEVYGHSEVVGAQMADVRFSGWPEPERGILVDDLEVVGSARDRQEYAGPTGSGRRSAEPLDLGEGRRARRTA
jgi:hypothetical protein